MSKSVLMSIQPYWGFLIIAEAKGWNIEKYGLHEKTVEVRKSEPKDPDWDKTVELYFTKDKKSLARIPEEYRKEVEALCGKVVAEFVCDVINEYDFFIGHGVCGYVDGCQSHCLTMEELCEYGNGKNLYGWHISELKVYDIPKELSEFKKAGFMTEEEWLFNLYPNTHCHYEAWAKKFNLERPPQSWCYVEEI